MKSLLILAFSSFLFSLILTPLFRWALRCWDVVDRPDQSRKLHHTPVPRAGGLPILLSCIGALAVLAALPGSGSLAHQHMALILTVFPAAMLAFLTGLLDDLFGIKPWQKLAGLFAAAILACALGIRIEAVAGHPAQIWWSLPLTVLWLVACANAFNLIDGLDGLAAGLGLLATLAMLLAAFLQSNLEMALALVTLAGALIGFLRYNYSPASIFLGDSGSLLIGFLLGCFGVAWSQKSATVVAMMAPSLALAVPLLDSGLAVVRRLVRRQPLFSGDRGHIHHRLLDRGLSQRKVVLMLYGACIISAGFSLLQGLGRGELGGLVLCLFVVAAWWGVRYLDYREIAALSRLLTGPHLRQRLQQCLWDENLEAALRRAHSLEDCWSVTVAAAQQVGCTQLELAGGCRVFSTGPAAAPLEWRIEARAGDFGVIRFAGQSSEIPLAALATIVTLLRQHLERLSAPAPAPRSEPVPIELQALHTALWAAENTAAAQPH